MQKNPEKRAQLNAKRFCLQDTFFYIKKNDNLLQKYFNNTAEENIQKHELVMVFQEFLSAAVECMHVTTLSVA